MTSIIEVNDDQRHAPAGLDVGLRQWIMAGLASVVVLGGGWWLNSVDAKSTDDHKRLNAVLERMAVMEATSAATQRDVAAVAAGLKEASSRFDTKLDRMDGKLDGVTALLTGRPVPGTFNSQRFR